MKTEKTYCGCGCGEIVEHRYLYPSQIRNQGPLRFKKGHQNRGLKHTEEHIEQTKHSLEKNGRWNGGRMIDRDGYVLIKTPSHPFANNHNYVREHRLVMESHIGRILTPSEIVHHKNGNKRDNRIENLEIVTVDRHAFMTNKGTKKPRANRVHFVCERCGKEFYRSHYYHDKIVKFCSWGCRYQSA